MEAKTSARKGSCPRGLLGYWRGRFASLLTPHLRQLASLQKLLQVTFLFLPLFQSTVLQPFWTNLNIFGNILFRGGSKLVPEQLWFLRQNVAN